VNSTPPTFPAPPTQPADDEGKQYQRRHCWYDPFSDGPTGGFEQVDLLSHRWGTSRTGAGWTRAARTRDGGGAAGCATTGSGETGTDGAAGGARAEGGDSATGAGSSCGPRLLLRQSRKLTDDLTADILDQASTELGRSARDDHVGGHCDCGAVPVLSETGLDRRRHGALARPRTARPAGRPQSGSTPVTCPWPCGEAPVTTSTFPVASIRMLACSHLQRVDLGGSVHPGCGRVPAPPSIQRMMKTNRRQQRSGLCSGVRAGSMIAGGMNSTRPGWMRISQPA